MNSGNVNRDEMGETGAESESDGNVEIVRSDTLPHNVAPHRGSMLIFLAFLGWVSCPIFSIVTWIMASGDLAKMAVGQMDRSGEGSTKGAKLLAVINCVAWPVGILIGFLFMCVLPVFFTGAVLSEAVDQAKERELQREKDLVVAVKEVAETRNASEEADKKFEDLAKVAVDMARKSTDTAKVTADMTSAAVAAAKALADAQAKARDARGDDEKKKAAEAVKAATEVKTKADKAAADGKKADDEAKEAADAAKKASEEAKEAADAAKKVADAAQAKVTALQKKSKRKKKNKENQVPGEDTEEIQIPDSSAELGPAADEKGTESTDEKTDKEDAPKTDSPADNPGSAGTSIDEPTKNRQLSPGSRTGTRFQLLSA